jgi:hypothetical protein
MKKWSVRAPALLAMALSCGLGLTSNGASFASETNLSVRLNNSSGEPGTGSSEQKFDRASLRRAIRLLKQMRADGRLMWNPNCAHGIELSPESNEIKIFNWILLFAKVDSARIGTVQDFVTQFQSLQEQTHGQDFATIRALLEANLPITTISNGGEADLSSIFFRTSEGFNAILSESDERVMELASYSPSLADILLALRDLVLLVQPKT